MTPEELEVKRQVRRMELDAVNDALPELEFRGYGNGMPWQGDGKYLPGGEGSEFYMRFRHNQASMTVYQGEAFESDALLSAVIWPFYEYGSEEARDGYAGELHGYDEIVPMAQQLLARLAPVSEDNPTSQTILVRDVEALLAACKNTVEAPDD
jgi:hypothetical protein